MTWDATYLYVARSNLVSGNGISLYVDLDPLPTPTGGSDSSGNTTNGSELWGASMIPYIARLPFRADTRVLAGGGVLNMDVASGTGTWTAVMPSPPGMAAASSGTVLEIRIPWAGMGMAGLTGPPVSFRWLGYELVSGDMFTPTQTQNQAPSANPATGAQLPYFFSITSTGDGSSTNPFSRRESTWRVSDASDSGPNSLRDAITNANADAGSSHRFITFDQHSSEPPLGSIGLASQLPAITEAVTIDGTTHKSYFAIPPYSPAVIIAGNGTFDGLTFNGVSSSFVRALNLHLFDRAIVMTGGDSNTISGNWIGLDSGGTIAFPNQIGIHLDGGTGTVIGGTTEAEANAVSGNTTGIRIENTTDTVMTYNYVGTDRGGALAIPNGTGINVLGSSGTVIGGDGAGNVISGNTGHGVLADTNELTILGNKIGVTEALTPLGNGGDGINGTSNLTIGSIAVPNTIAHNNQGISVDSGNLLIRGNSVHSNTTAAIVVSGGITPPTISAAAVDGNVLTINFSVDATSTVPATQSIQLDLYEASPSPVPETVQYRATSPCYSGDSLNEVFWTVGSPFAPGVPLTVMATAYEDAACSDPGEGTSSPSGTFMAASLAMSAVTLGTSTTTAYTGESVTFTATVTSPAGVIGGTVTVKDGDDPIPGCEAVAVVGGEAVCVGSFPTEGLHALVATFHGDGISSFSSSNTVNVTVTTVEFTGPGNFSDPSKWTGNTLPAAGVDILINGQCTFDELSPGDIYRDLILADGASVVWGSDHGVPLSVRDIYAVGSSSIIDMSVGGLLESSGGWEYHTFIAGNGSVRLNGTSQQIPPDQTYNALLISGSVDTLIGTATIRGDLVVENGGSLELNSGTIAFAGGSGHTIQNLGTLTLFDLSIPGTESVDMHNGLTLSGTLTVDGLFTPQSGAIVSGGTVTGSGRIRVTGIEPDSFASQYTGTRTITNLTVEFAGTAQQSIDCLPYHNLHLNNPAGAVMAEGECTLDGTLNLEEGILQAGGSTVFFVANTSPTAIVWSNGWVAGPYFGRSAASGTNMYVFPVGTLSSPTTATVTLHNAGMESYLYANPGASFTSGSGSGIDPARDANVQWKVQAGAATDSIDVTFEHGSLSDPAADPTRFALRMKAEGPGAQPWVHVGAVAGPASISATAVSAPAGYELYFMAGNQLIDRYDVSAGSLQYRETPFAVTVTARDILDVQVNDSTTAVTMSSGSGNVEFDANGDSTFGDNTKTLSDGQFAIQAKGTVAETTTIIATDGNAKTGATGNIFINEPAPFGPPPSFSASADGSARVIMSWSGVLGATQYDIERKSSGSVYAPLASTSNTHYIDDDVTPNTTYLYRVRAVNTGGASDFSAPDLTTTVAFTDVSLDGLTIKAVHVEELRTAIHAMFTHALGSSPVGFTDPDLMPGLTPVKKIHLDELRDHLDLARMLLGFSQYPFTDATITSGVTLIKAAHIQEIRAAVE